MALCLAALMLAACAGDGEGLDENGRPIEGMEDALLPELASIQSKVFTPICTTCHAGSAAPLGLRLEEGASFAMLVNAPSAEVPALLRVAPGNPDASYLIQKLEGTAAVGGRMPLNGPPLPAETIAVIRQWITAGAPQGSAQPADANKVTTLDPVWPMPGSSVRESTRVVVLSASSMLDTTLLDAGVVALRRSGGDGDFANQNEQVIHASIRVRSLEPTVLALTAPDSEWVADQYELRVSGGMPLALADQASRPIDGDGDGEPGGDFVLRFAVEESR
jgi:hypothetical protein